MTVSMTVTIYDMLLVITDLPAKLFRLAHQELFGSHCRLRFRLPHRPSVAAPNH